MMELFNWQGHAFWLSAQRYLYWEKEQLLLLSDLHLGKTGHFRKEGIAVPSAAHKEDMQRLFHAIQLHNPKSVVIVGDMFHSHSNQQHDWFAKWRNDFSRVHFTLVKGNHDILQADWYKAQQIEVVPEMVIHNLCLVHDLPASDNISDTCAAYVCGHLHPAIRVTGTGRQTLRLPCFYFGENMLVLPAFGRFTGTWVVKPKKKDRVFAIAGQQLIAL